MLIRVAVAIAFLAYVISAKLESGSFQGPFEEVDQVGNRVVSKHWRTSGTAEVNKNFIRLTPDRQSKRGSVWMKSKLSNPNIATTVKFRISGQGKNFFGDGIGIWFSDTAFWNEGDLHGGQESFKGIAVIIDTFKNTENISLHRDVSVLINDGQKTYETMKHVVTGCNTTPTPRYHNERADFQVTDASRILIAVEGTLLKIQIDARNTGEWQECVDMNISELASDWLVNSYMGITASTGQLGDNHDIISVSSDTDVRKGVAFMAQEKRILESGNKIAPVTNIFPSNPNGPVEARLLKIEKAINDIMLNMDKLGLEIDHFGVDTDEKIKNIIGKLSKREDEAERRLDVIEHIVREQVEHHVVSHIEDRLADHEAGIKADLQETVNDIADHIDRQVDVIERHKDEVGTYVKETADNVLGNLSGSGGAWKVAFFFQLVLFVVVAAGLYHQIVKIKKSHFL